MENTPSISGIAHWLFFFISSVYAFVFKRNWVDYIYIYIAVFIVLHWTLLNGECIITYLHKKQENPEYKAGETSSSNKDMEILPIGETANNYILKGLVLVLLGSIYSTYVRNGFPRWIPIVFILSFCVYEWMLITSENCCTDETFQMYQRIIFYIVLGVLGSTAYYTLYRPTQDDYTLYRPPQDDYTLYRPPQDDYTRYRPPGESLEVGIGIGKEDALGDILDNVSREV